MSSTGGKFTCKNCIIKLMNKSNSVTLTWMMLSTLQLVYWKVIKMREQIVSCGLKLIKTWEHVVS